LILAVMQAETARMRRAAHLFGAVLGAFVAAHLPGLILAINDGYLGALIGQYLSYPIMLADYGLRGAGTLFGAGATEGSAASALLQRPHLFGAADFTEVQRALLIYLPPLVIVGFVAYTLLTARRRVDPLAYCAQMLVVLVAGAAALPHYFFYRPDLSHVANFMPGFTVLAGVFMWQLGGRTRRRALIAVPIAAMLGLYLWTALTQEGSGSIAGTFARTERFSGANGVNVRVYPGEKALLEDLKAVIEANSAPGDAIVCVPYCPGIAFMTGRRLLFREQYVDDTLPSRDPQWIDRAIAVTVEKRPPVVIVMDWAINGTDISRFSRWAAPYMETLESLARQKLERPGFSIYLL
jgi:hypothetical protein